jgi:hypothetical protein
VNEEVPKLLESRGINMSASEISAAIDMATRDKVGCLFVKFTFEGRGLN